MAPTGIDVAVGRREQQSRTATSSRSRQRLLSIFLPLSVTLLVVGQGSTPKGLDQLIRSKATALKMLPIAQAHTDRLYFSNVLVVFGLGSLGVSFAAIASLVRERGSAAATAAAAIGGFAAFCGAIGNILVGFNLAATESAHLSKDAAAQYLVSSFTSTVGNVILLSYLIGISVAAILMALALTRSGLLPRWIPLVFVIGLGLAASAPAGFVTVPLSAPFIVAMVALTSRIWSAATLEGAPQSRN